MRALLLAAGRGSRLEHLTNDQPKCLTELFGKALLDWQLSALHASGVHEIAVVKGYLGEKISGRGAAEFTNSRWASTNMVGSLLCGDAWLQQGDCLVCYTDLYYEADTIKRLAAAAGDIVIAFDPNWKALWQRRFKNPLDDAESFKLDEHGDITDIGRRVTDEGEIQGQYMGLLKFTPQGWRTVAEYLASQPGSVVDVLDMTTLLRNLIGRGVKIRAVAVQEPWYEVDRLEDLRVYQETTPAGSR